MGHLFWLHLYRNVKIYWAESFPGGCLPSQEGGKNISSLLAWLTRTISMKRHNLNSCTVTRGAAVMVSVLFCQHVLYVRVLRINRVYSKEFKAVSCSQWQPTRCPFPPHISLVIVLTLPPDGSVLLRSRAPWGPPAPGVLHPGSLVAHLYFCVESPSRWERMHIHALSSGSFQPRLPVGEQWGGTASRDPAAMGMPLAKQFFPALFSPDARDVCLRSQWICHRNLLYWDYMCY